MITKRERWLMQKAFIGGMLCAGTEDNPCKDRLFKWWMNSRDTGKNVASQLDDKAPPRQI